MHNYLYKFETWQERTLIRGMFSKLSLRLVTVRENRVCLLCDSNIPWFLICGLIPANTVQWNCGIVYDGDNTWGCIEDPVYMKTADEHYMCFGARLQLSLGDKLFFDQFIEEQIKLIL